jgi:hypothetical protein
MDLSEGVWLEVDFGHGTPAPSNVEDLLLPQSDGEPLSADEFYEALRGRRLMSVAAAPGAGAGVQP